MPMLHNHPILQYILKRWIRLGFLLTTSVLASVLEFVGMGVLIPIVLLKISDGAEGQLGNVKGIIASYVPTVPGVEMTTTLMIFFICILLLRSLFRVLQVFSQERLLTSWKGDLSRMILEEYIFNGYRDIYNTKKSAMMTTVNMANKFFNKTVMAAIDSISAVIITIIFVGAVAFLDPPTAVVAMAIMGGIVIAQRFITNSLSDSLEDEDVAFGQRRQQALNEVLSMTKEVKLLNREHAVIRKFARANRMVNKRSAMLKTFNELPRALAQAFFVITIGLAVLYVSAEANNPRTQISIVLIVFVGLRLLPRVNRIQNAMQSFAETRSVRSKIAAILKNHTRLINKPWKIQGVGVDKELRLEEVEFQHTNSSRPALRDISLTIKTGELIAIIGESGAGKSTLLDLLMGLLNPDEGRILADGKPVSSETGIWRRLGYLSQNPIFIDGTIKENIALGAKNSEIDIKRVWEAVRFAGLERFVNAFPEGLDAPVGDNADQLSAGERQRLGLARAYFNAEDVIFLDEPTANLDPATEASIVSSLYNRPKDLTVVMVAHRHTTIRQADQIFYLKNGEISARGGYDELFAKELIHA